MSDSSYITNLRQAQTLVGARFVPSIVNNVISFNNNNNNNGNNNNGNLSFPSGFSVQSITPNSVLVNITGSVNISENLNVEGGIDPLFLQLKPQTGSNSPFNLKGTLWVRTYFDNQNQPQYSLNLDDKLVYDTTNLHITSISNLEFQTLKATILNVDSISTSATNQTSTITINAHLVPSATNTFSLGTSQTRWSTIYADKLFVSPNTIIVSGDDGKEMSISYDVTNGTSFITHNEVTVQTVTTSKTIPGIIDPALISFSGLSFASKINLSEYKNNIGDSLINLLLRSIYTLDISVNTTRFSQPDSIPEYNINMINEALNGKYYIVVNNNRNNEQIFLPKIKASLNSTKSILTSKFSLHSEELLSIGDGDILIIVSSCIPNGENFDFYFGIQNINFRLPINSINNSNIIDNSITENKLVNQSISNTKLANKSITLRTLSDDVIDLILNKSIDNSTISSISCLCNNIESKVNTLEKYIKLLSYTYFIKDTYSGSTITLDNINEIEI